MIKASSTDSQLKFALAIGLPLAFASGLVVAGLLLLAMLEFGVADKLGRLEARWHGESAVTAESVDASPGAIAAAPSMMANEAPGDGSVIGMVLLEEELAAARVEREGLLDEIRVLTERLQDLEGEAWIEGSNATPADAAPGEPRPSRARDERTDQERERDALLAAGVDTATAESFQRQNDEIALARLELYDRASREGWLGSDEFEQELDALDEARLAHREVLGDEAFDRYLHASGRPNRVAVDTVIGGSAAEAAGLAPGDRIIGYAGERIYTLPELQNATRDGARGENVQMTVVREGETLVFDVPRGPLGVSLAGRREAPPES